MSQVPPERSSRDGTSRPAVPSREQRVRALEKLARRLDTQFRIPMTDWRVGWDGLIGLIPGIGDTISAAFSAYLLIEAWRLGVRKRTLVRMIGNAVADLALGSIPLVGDAFDIAWKANSRNINLIIADIARARK